MRTKTIYVGLGSNLGDRHENLRHAIEAFPASGVDVIRQSTIYETAPLLVTEQPWFLNLVVEARTALFPVQLLHTLQAIEKSLGRKRHQNALAKGPRIIDLDILFFGSAVLETPQLSIPHPGIPDRRFVLEPLAELSPALRHPITKRTIRQMLHAESVQRQTTRPWSLPSSASPLGYNR